LGHEERVLIRRFHLEGLYKIESTSSLPADFYLKILTRNALHRASNVLLFRLLRSQIFWISLPMRAHAEHLRDLLGLSCEDPGIEQAIDEGAAWLARAQDHSASSDGGVSRHYSLINGWATSYPETTGYIVPTMIAYAKLRRDEAPRRRAKRMLDWLVSIQLECGAFQGGLINATPLVPVTFNTGQILLGLASGVNEFGEYRESLIRAADWLVKTQDTDGCWRNYPTPFAMPGIKSYETHVAWGLFEAARIEPNRSYAEAATANVRWALQLQNETGWFKHCCLSDPLNPLTHTIGYALRGVIEAYRFSKNDFFLEAACRTADGLLHAFRPDGFLPGRLAPDWTPAVDWVCLTGTAQIAHCWLMLYRYTDKILYRDAGFAANKFVRRTLKLMGPSEMRGGVKGSFPISGLYNRYEYLNWACKFMLDANMLEKQIREQLAP
jgi:hypothetical protein